MLIVLQCFTSGALTSSPSSSSSSFLNCYSIQFSNPILLLVSCLCICSFAVRFFFCFFLFYIYFPRCDSPPNGCKSLCFFFFCLFYCVKLCMFNVGPSAINSTFFFHTHSHTHAIVYHGKNYPQSMHLRLAIESGPLSSALFGHFFAVVWQQRRRSFANRWFSKGDFSFYGHSKVRRAKKQIYNRTKTQITATFFLLLLFFSRLQHTDN